MKKATIENKSSVTIHGLKPGARLSINVDRNGVPLDRNWRRRLQDSAIDGSIVVVKETKAKKEG